MSQSMYFTPAKEDGKEWIQDTETNKKWDGERALSGEEAKLFYQSLIEENEETVAKRRRENRKCRERGKGRKRHVATQAASNTERDGHKLLRLAQEGDTAGLQRLLGSGCNVNFRDGFYWTALMCASYAGRLHAVRTLLQQGAAWVGVVDSEGRDARDLADQAGHLDVVRELEQHGASTENTHTHTQDSPGSRRRWCPVCECEFSETPQKHNSSTLHQFSTSGTRPPPTPQYCLPAHSMGYRLMLRSGWDPASGLGPSGSGRKQPIGTVLKRDQAGLGYGPALKPKVTHFQAKDSQAVKCPAKERKERGATVTRKAARKREEEHRNLERDFRLSFNVDL